MCMFRWFLPLSLILFSTSIARADVITFEDLDDSTPVITRYPNLVFSNATAITSGVTLNEFEFPPHSGINVVFDDGGPMSITFTTPVSNVGAYFTYNTRITIVAYDGANNPIATITSVFDNNEALSGDLGSHPNEFLVFSMLGGISRITITGSLTGSSFVMDDLTFTAIPEPGTIFLLLTGSGMLVGLRKRFHR